MIFDIVCFCCIVISTTLGVLRGFLLSFFSFLVLVLSLFCSRFLFKFFEGVLHSYFGDVILVNICNFIACICLYFCISFILSKCVNLFLSDVGKNNLINYFLGSVLGFIRGSILSCIVFSLIVFFNSIHLKHHKLKADSFKDFVRNIPVSERCVKNSLIFSPFCFHTFAMMEKCIGKNQVDKILDKVPFVQWYSSNNKYLN